MGFRSRVARCARPKLETRAPCAFAGTLGQMIAMRGLQGFAGGVLIPMAFTIFFINTAPGVAMVVALWFTLAKQPMQLRLLKEGDWRAS